MKKPMHPDCYNPACLNPDTQCEKCQEYVALPPIAVMNSTPQASVVPFPGNGIVHFPRLKPLADKIVEPLMEVEKGFGYYGTLLYDEGEDKVQCHECGGLYKKLGGTHLRMHKLDARGYKEKYELNYGTALQSPSVSRQNSIRGEFLYRLNHGNLDSQTIRKFAMETSIKSKKTRKKIKKKMRLTVEMMNRFGTCPKQVEERFIKIIEEMGKTPSWDELYKKDASLLAVLIKRFKGYSSALSYFGLKTKRRVTFGTYGLKNVRLALEKFVDTQKRLPTAKDTKVGLLPDYTTISKYYGDWYKAKEFAFRRLAMKYPSEAAKYDEHYRRKRI